MHIFQGLSAEQAGHCHRLRPARHSHPSQEKGAVGPEPSQSDGAAGKGQTKICQKMRTPPTIGGKPTGDCTAVIYNKNKPAKKDRRKESMNEEIIKLDQSPTL